MNPVTRSQAVLVSAQASRLALSVVIAGLLGRNLAPADFGFVALVSSIYLVAVEVLDMGTSAIATREIVARPAHEREILAALLALRRLMSLVAFAAVTAVAFSGYVQREDERIVLVVAACGLLFLHLQGYHLVFQVRQAYGRVSSLALAAQAGFLIAAAAALKLAAGGAVIALLVVAREVFVTVCSRWMAVRMLGERLRPAWLHPGFRPLLKAAWMVGVAGFSYRLATQTGGFILWEVSSPASLASFNAAQRLLAPMVEMAWLFAIPLVAAMSGAMAHGHSAFRVQLEGSVKFLLCVSSLAAVAGYFIAPLILRLLYGDLYSTGQWSAVGAFRWLALGCVFAVVSPVLIVSEMVQGHAKPLLFTGVSCLVLNLAGNSWAIPRFGAEGAGMMFLACEAFVFLVLFTRRLARGDVGLNAGWAAYLVPAALLGGVLSLLADAPVWQLAVACAWAPAALLAVLQLPGQKDLRASLALVAAKRQPQAESRA